MIFEIIKKIKNFVKKNKVLNPISKPVYFWFMNFGIFNIFAYWEKRYKHGNSGSGSFGKLAIFKAEIINNFIEDKKIYSVLEFGCGDGNQLGLFNIQKYIGLDISKKSIELCIKKFNQDNKKSFFLYHPSCFIDKHDIFKSDAVLSLDVIYHLVDEGVFSRYMSDLFLCASKYVIIYSSNTTIQEKYQLKHVLHRKFTDWIETHAPDWKLEKIIHNKYPLKAYNFEEESWSDFYIYEMKGAHK